MLRAIPDHGILNCSGHITLHVLLALHVNLSVSFGRATIHKVRATSLYNQVIKHEAAIPKHPHAGCRMPAPPAGLSVKVTDLHALMMLSLRARE